MSSDDNGCGINCAQMGCIFLALGLVVIFPIAGFPLAIYMVLARSAVNKLGD